ncbi:M4 family metallopeptidase [Nocardioides sp.]|uniref:M4 family metallopeptidase n=1 Tax=Nocardioides sp. TaxID=35761 RepID=UPI002D7FF0D3|nr:M4 family metallopeptidase [Nocardioides sp.]HET8962057.1 M4 family metallopeptidase [Nocardioides sp.]
MKILSQASCLVLVGAGLAGVSLTQAAAAPTASAAPGQSLVQQMRTAADAPVSFSPELSTGRVGFVRVARTGDLNPADAARTALGAADKAGDYLAEFAPAFGATPEQLRQTGVRSTRYGTTVTFEQVYRGVPVFGSMLRAQLDEQGDLTSVNGYAAPDIDISVTPRLSAGQAATRALRAVRADPPSHDGVRAGTAGIRAASTDLVVYRTGATRGVAGDTVLAYVVEVTNRSNIRDMVFVEADAGKLLNRYSVMDTALDRHVFEQRVARNTEVWAEGDPFPGALNVDQQNIVLGSGESYWFFDNAFGRDSYDGAGASMNTVNNDPTIACPNANWNGITTNYCNGVTADDVVAHEWGHAYTEFTHGLIYQFQPGALNESYSDIWGETVDLINGRMDNDEGDIDTKRPDGQCSAFTRGAISMVINSPASAAGPCTAAPAAFGPVFPQAGVTTNVVVGQDAANPTGPATTDGCTALSNAGAVAGSFVYLDRGTCTFQVKADNASAAGAAGIVVGDNVAGRAPISMSGTSDIFGLMVTLEDGARMKAAGTVNATIRDNRTAPAANSFRWLMGEDATAFGGAIRDMWSPTCYNDPGKVSDAQYFCDTDDGGGVHSNSGVPNHAYALTVDGGTFNGQTISGIGLTKAAAVYFRAMTVYQTPTTDFADHADALRSACADLVGQPLNNLSTEPDDSTVSTEVISAADCTTFDAVAAAVELRRPPTQCNFQPMFDRNPPRLCGANTTSRTVFAENFSDGLADWGTASEVVFPRAEGSPWVADSTLPKGRAGTAAYGPAPDQGQCDGSPADFSSRDSIISPVINIPSGAAVARKLSFDHYVATELGFDGGNVKYRDGRTWKVIPASAYTFNGPDQLETAAAGNTNPMAGERGFTGTDGGEVTGSWGTSQINLSAIGVTGGQSLRLRFDIGRDGCGGIDGWYVDDVTVTVCVRRGARLTAGAPAGRNR